MSETMKERKDMDPQYMWDLSTLFKNDEEWNNALPELDEMIKKLPEYQGKLIMRKQSENSLILIHI